MCLITLCALDETICGFIYYYHNAIILLVCSCIIESDKANSLSAPKTYSPSVKAQAWTADTSSLEGVFAQHAQPPPMNSQQQADDFGEFHSVSASAPTVAMQMGNPPPQQSSQQQGPPMDASRFPPVYMEVYRRCVKSGETYLSTEFLFPILLSSQLPKSVLGDLWTKANRAVPGKLNQMELFVLLGLIGLVQVAMYIRQTFMVKGHHEHIHNTTVLH